MRPALKIVILTTVAQPLADRGGRQPPGAFILPLTLTWCCHLRVCPELSTGCDQVENSLTSPGAAA